MSRTLIRHAAAGATLLLALSLSACGGGDDSGDGGNDEAGSEETSESADAGGDDLTAFCEAIQGNAEDVPENPTLEEQLELVQSAVERLRDTPVPEDMPAQAQQGLDVYLEASAALETEDLQTLQESPGDQEVLAQVLDLDQQEERQVQALQEWLVGNCSASAP